MADDEQRLERVILTRLVRLNAKIQGLVTGLVAGLGVFIVTNWLVLKGGHLGPHGEPLVGPHLALLSQFFIGYRVTFLGSFVGFVYAFVCGFIVGYSVARIYNWIAGIREGQRSGNA